MEANMDSPQPHSTATKALEVLSAALTIIRRLFLGFRRTTPIQAIQAIQAMALRAFYW